MKYLVVGSIHDSYTTEFISEILCKKNVEIDLLSMDDCGDDQHIRQSIESMGIRVIIAQIPKIRLRVLRWNISILIKRFFTFRICKVYDSIFVLQVG